MRRLFALALVLTSVSHLVPSTLDPLGLVQEIGPMLSATELASFMHVWWHHLGLYAGLLVGVIWTVVAVSRARRRVGHPQLSTSPSANSRNASK